MIVAGFGFRKKATVESLRSALRLAAGEHKVFALASHAEKDGALVEALADELGLPHLRIAGSVVVAQPVETQSSCSEAAYGTGSVAEALALAGAGAGAKLLGPREVSEDRAATCALAKGEAS
ncbi:cobalamin biosynthesis protein [Poseidonocella sedimentorum]|uniref:Cobalt-precorrin 5A hydrolase n=1 Tax=Poseidonocella sedimentorum TaxID=871652 RepID=A0A1I6EK32_9RHOB|nr:cobalamin biosynthesis protein [Poseidonocella sedimentorum]SFR18017.1 cobalt-precorrin 5A hydrolase [Poseidonocella sedimentorum]